MRIKLIINYVGTDFSGWQSQPKGGSVQDRVEDALFSLCGERVRLCASGRTDAGVHAFGQVAHFDLKKDFDPKKIASGLNFYLPLSIRVASAECVSDDFHARGSAKKKTYIYLMYKSYFDNAIFDGKALKIPEKIDVLRMKQAAKHFEGTHDFFAFMSAGSSAKTSVRTVFRSEIIATDCYTSLAGDGEDRSAATAGEGSSVASDSQGTIDGIFTPPLIIYRVTANGFLYNMVRKMVAYILRAGSGNIEPDDIPRLIAAKDRTLTRDTAKAHGLYLHSVEY